MAWRNGARLTGKHVKAMFRKWRQPPQPDLPPGGIVPRSVMRELQWRQLPFDKNAYERGLQELLAVYDNGGG